MNLITVNQVEIYSYTIEHRVIILSKNAHYFINYNNYMFLQSPYKTKLFNTNHSFYRFRCF